MSRQAVLVLSHDVLAAALLGAAAELVGYAPSFPLAGEPSRAALRRTRPAVVLIDCDHDESCTEAFVGPALMTGARVVIFRSSRSERDVVPFAARLALPVLTMPVDVEELRVALEERVEYRVTSNE